MYKYPRRAYKALLGLMLRRPEVYPAQYSTYNRYYTLPCSSCLYKQSISLLLPTHFILCTLFFISSF
nr:MAG TPA: hypothetical protein [Caudoviricetes sp.]